MADTKGEQPSPTEAFIYEHIKEATRQQMDDADKLDDKMLRVFSAASVVLGLLGLSSAGKSGWSSALFLVPLAPYLFTAVYAFRQLNPRPFERAMLADQLRQYAGQTKEVVRRAVVKKIDESYRKNDVLLKAKAECVRRALVATSIEVVLAVVALILYRLL